MNISNLISTKFIPLDPHKFEPISIVSHAHSDHVALNPYNKKRYIICTPQTADIIKLRYKESNLEIITLPYFKEVKVNDLLPNEYLLDENIFLSLYPAGHVLGSAQICVRTTSICLVYTGDFKLKENLSTDKLEFPNHEVDILIMESTFGRKKYIFPELIDIKKDLFNFCDIALEQNEIPVVLAYSLGKSQEVMQILKDKYDLVVHSSIGDICNIYKKYGYEFKEFKTFSKDKLKSELLSEKSVVILQPHFYKSSILKNIPNRKVCVVSGWAIDNHYKYTHNANSGISLSDHADFTDLINYAKRINAKITYTTHGFSLDLAKELNNNGINAEPLKEFMTYSLF